MSHSPGKTSSVPSGRCANALSILHALSSASGVQQIAQALGPESELHLVGGAVRDSLAGKPGFDIDLTSKIRPEEAQLRLTKAGIRVIETGLKHGTLTAHIDGKNIELTTFRDIRPGALSPFAESIEVDLSGRDFTINAIAYSVVNQNLVDPFHGQEDLAQGVLRGVESPTDRLKEDPLRLLRMIRFGPAAGRTIHPDTKSAAMKLAPLIQKVSAERIQVELTKILCALNPAQALRCMHEVGLLKEIVPEAIESVGFEQNEFHAYDVFEHTLRVIENCPPEPRLRLAALFHDLGKPQTLSVDEDGRRHFYKHELLSTSISKAVMRRLKYSTADTDEVSTIVRLHMRPIECGKPGLRRLIKELGDYFENWLTFKRADALGAKITGTEFDEKLARFKEMLEEERARVKGSVFGRLAIDGSDLIALGLKEGPMIGTILKQLEELVLDNPEANDRETLLGESKRLLEKGKI